MTWLFKNFGYALSSVLNLLNKWLTPCVVCFGQQVACMQLINALVTSPDELDFRIHLRNEFLRCGLKKILPVSKKNSLCAGAEKPTFMCLYSICQPRQLCTLAYRAIYFKLLNPSKCVWDWMVVEQGISDHRGPLPLPLLLLKCWRRNCAHITSSSPPGVISGSASTIMQT